MSNILFITTDQLSLHGLSCYDSYLCKTPAVDALAQEGIRFTRCYTPCALCTPARASILSGLYPHNHGALHNSGIMIPFSEEEIGGRISLFPSLLEQKGYQLGYQGKWHAGVSRTANDLGFQGFGPAGYGHYKDSPRYEAYLQERGLRPPEEHIEFYAQSDKNWMDSAGYETGDLEATGTYFLTEEAIGMVDAFSRKEAPYFLWLSYWGPHAPYWPHESYLDLYPPEQIRKWQSFDEPWENKPYAHRRFRESVMPHTTNADWSQWSRIISRYYAQTRMIDDQIGRLIAHLKTTGLYDDLTIIFTADHGDSLGIHGGVFDKGPMAYEQIYHVPLIVKPSRAQARGVSRDAYVSLLDLASTFCELGGTKMEDTDGASLVPLLETDPGTAENREDFMAEFHGHRFPVGQRIQWWGDYKYVLNFADKDELYYLPDDPEEMVNLIEDSSLGPVRQELRERMLKNLRASRDNLHPQAYRVLSHPSREEGGAE